MSDLRPRGATVILDGVERHFLFTLNVIDAVQEKTGRSMRDVIGDLTNEETVMHTLRDLVVILSEDEVEREKFRNPDCALQPLTERQAGFLIGIDNLWEVARAVLRAYGLSLPEPEEDEDPNGGSGQMKS